MSFGLIGFNGEWWLNIILTHKILLCSYANNGSSCGLTRGGAWGKLIGGGADANVEFIYLCEKGQDEFHRRKPHLDLTLTRYARVINSMETELKKERNVVV